MSTHSRTYHFLAAIVLMIGLALLLPVSGRTQGFRQGGLPPRPSLPANSGVPFTPNPQPLLAQGGFNGQTAPGPNRGPTSNGNGNGNAMSRGFGRNVMGNNFGGNFNGNGGGFGGNGGGFGGGNPFITDYRQQQPGGFMMWSRPGVAQGLQQQQFANFGGQFGGGFSGLNSIIGSFGGQQASGYANNPNPFNTFNSPYNRFNNFNNPYNNVNNPFNNNPFNNNFNNPFNNPFNNNFNNPFNRPVGGVPFVPNKGQLNGGHGV
jgi:hypothetical protein